jgi:hypothetical protein
MTTSPPIRRSATPAAACVPRPGDRVAVDTRPGEAEVGADHRVSVSNAWVARVYAPPVGESGGEIG